MTKPQPNLIIEASDSTSFPWLKVLGYSAVAGGGVAVLIVILGAIFAGLPGGFSAFAAAVVVMVFFAISLLVAHVVSKTKPDAVLAAFMITYVIKVIAFGFLLLIQPDESWFSRGWAVAGAVGAFIAWQAAEMVTLMKVRQRVYN